MRLKFTISPALNESVVALSDENAVVLMDSTVPVSVGEPVPAKVAVPFSTPELIAAQPGEAQLSAGANATTNKMIAIAYAEKRDIAPYRQPVANFSGARPSSPRQMYQKLS